MGTYSGGTVRDSHPVILFSSTGSSPEPPRNFCSVVCFTIPHRRGTVNGHRRGSNGLLRGSVQQTWSKEGRMGPSLDHILPFWACIYACFIVKFCRHQQQKNRPRQQKSWASQQRHKLVSGLLRMVNPR